MSFAQSRKENKSPQKTMYQCGICNSTWSSYRSDRYWCTKCRSREVFLARKPKMKTPGSAPSNSRPALGSLNRPRSSQSMINIYQDVSSVDNTPDSPPHSKEQDVQRTGRRKAEADKRAEEANDYCEQGLYEIAVKRLTHAIALVHDSAKLYEQRSYVYTRLNRLDEARSDLFKAGQLKTNEQLTTADQAVISNHTQRQPRQTIRGPRGAESMTELGNIPNTPSSDGRPTMHRLNISVFDALCANKFRPLKLRSLIKFNITEDSLKALIDDYLPGCLNGQSSLCFEPATGLISVNQLPQLCRYKTQCHFTDCELIHICHDFILDRCRNPNCRDNHDYENRQNIGVLEAYNLEGLTTQQMNRLYTSIHRPNRLRPKLCTNYVYTGNCRLRRSCTYFHICKDYLDTNKKCKITCKLSHDLYDLHNSSIMESYNVDVDGMYSTEEIKNHILLWDKELNAPPQKPRVKVYDRMSRKHTFSSEGQRQPGPTSFSRTTMPNTRTNKSGEASHSLRNSYVWQFEIENGHGQNFAKSDQVILETAFRDASKADEAVKIEGRYLKINMDTISRYGQQELPGVIVRRQSSDDQWIWYISGQHGGSSWQKMSRYDDTGDVHATIECAYNLFKKNGHLNKMTVECAFGDSFEIDFNGFSAKDESGGILRGLRRRPGK